MKFKKNKQEKSKLLLSLAVILTFQTVVIEVFCDFSHHCTNKEYFAYTVASCLTVCPLYCMSSGIKMAAVIMKLL